MGKVKDYFLNSTSVSFQNVQNKKLDLKEQTSKAKKDTKTDQKGAKNGKY